MCNVSFFIQAYKVDLAHVFSLRCWEEALDDLHSDCRRRSLGSIVLPAALDETLECLSHSKRTGDQLEAHQRAQVTLCASFYRRRNRRESRSPLLLHDCNRHAPWRQVGERRRAFADLPQDHPKAVNVCRNRVLLTDDHFPELAIQKNGHHSQQVHIGTGW